MGSRKKAVLVGAVTWLAMPALAEPLVESLRCNAGIASVGDDAAAVRLKCGKPMMEATKQTLCLFERRISRCITVDAWTYNPGPGQFLHTMMIEGGKVVAIRQGERVD